MYGKYHRTSFRTKSLISVSVENTMSEKLAAAAIVIAIISKRKKHRTKKKTETVWVKPWLCRIIENYFK